MRRHRARKVARTIAEEEAADHECEELDCHVRLDPPTHYLDFNSKEAQKLSANVVREMTLFTINKLINVPLEIQHETIGKFLNHSLLKDMVPPFSN